MKCAFFDKHRQFWGMKDVPEPLPNTYGVLIKPYVDWIRPGIWVSRIENPVVRFVLMPDHRYHRDGEEMPIYQEILLDKG